MKSILRILTILLIGALVSGGMYFILGNTSLGPDTSGAPSFDQMPATADGDLSQQLARPEGESDRDSASLTRGLSEVGVSLAKLTGITIIVLLVQSLLRRLPRRRVVNPMTR